MLANGSNPEWVDPEPPLEWKSKDDLNGAVVYGAAVSMPTNKLCAFLVYYKVPFKRVQGKKAGPYKKVPVMDVGARQVNDSGIILKNVLPALGVQLDEEWSKEISLVWDATFRYNITSSDAGKLAKSLVLPSCCGCSAYLLTHYPRCFSTPTIVSNLADCFIGLVDGMQGSGLRSA